MNKLPFKMIQETPMEKYRAETFWLKEPETLVWIESFAKNATFFDIGANIGVYSLYVALFGLNMRICAFEPFEANMVRLQKNTELNEFTNIWVYPYAMSNFNGVSKFYLPKTEIGTSGGQINTKIDEYGVEFQPEKEQVTLVTTVDAFIEEHTIYPNYLKIDVDGQEWEVIQGMAKILENIHLRSVLVEINNNRQEIFNAFWAAGFTNENLFNTMRNHSRVRRAEEGIKAENVVFTR